MRKFRIAAIVPRYGEGLGGGAEALVKAVLEALLRDQRVAVEIEVWTTCATDHRTWLNALPVGISVEQGIPVHRFPVDDRNLDTFIRSEMMIADAWPLSSDEQLDWLASGVNSQVLYQHIAKEGGTFDLLLFAPYLFPTTFWGALIHPDRSVVIPCLHDEHYAYLGVFQHLFCRVRGLIFNHSEEQKLAGEINPQLDLERRSGVVGMGFEVVPDEAPHAILSSEIQSFLAQDTPFLLYSGRKEEGKNLPLLIDAVESLRERNPAAKLRLALIGAGTISFRTTLPEGVVDLGFVTEHEKDALFREAFALVQPSVNESFSIVLMEAWLRKTPVIVNRLCRVTRSHVEQAGGGLYFGDILEFVGVVEYLLKNPAARKRFGEAGADYVGKEYAWSAVIDRFWSTVKKFQDPGLVEHDSNGAQQSLSSEARG